MPDPDELLQVVTETATLEKRDVLTGRVRVSTRTELTEDSVSAALRRNNVSVTRVRIDREVESAPSIRTMVISP